MGDNFMLQEGRNIGGFRCCIQVKGGAEEGGLRTGGIRLSKAEDVETITSLGEVTIVCRREPGSGQRFHSDDFVVGFVPSIVYFTSTWHEVQ